MINDVLIHIKSSFDDKNEPITLLTQGIFTDEGGTPALEYDESSQSESGFQKTRICFLGNDVSLERKGEARTYLLFSKQKWSTSTLEDDATFSVYPTVIDYELTPEKGWLELDYSIIIGDYSSDNRVCIKYRSMLQ